MCMYAYLFICDIQNTSIIFLFFDCQSHLPKTMAPMHQAHGCDGHSMRDAMTALDDPMEAGD